MHSKIVALLGGACAITLGMAGIWIWQRAYVLAREATRPQVAEWGICSAAIALFAAAQVILAIFVIGRLYHRGLFDKVFKLFAAGVLMVSLVSAVALGLAGR